MSEEEVCSCALQTLNDTYRHLKTLTETYVVTSVFYSTRDCLGTQHGLWTFHHRWRRGLSENKR